MLTRQDFDEALSTPTATRIFWIVAIDRPDASFSSGNEWPSALAASISRPSSRRTSPASSSTARYVSTSSRRRVLVSGLTAWEVCGSMLGNPIMSIKITLPGGTRLAEDYQGDPNITLKRTLHLGLTNSCQQLCDSLPRLAVSHWAHRRRSAARSTVAAEGVLAAAAPPLRQRPRQGGGPATIRATSSGTPTRW